MIKELEHREINGIVGGNMGRLLGGILSTAAVGGTLGFMYATKAKADSVESNAASMALKQKMMRGAAVAGVFLGGYVAAMFAAEGISSLVIGIKNKITKKQV